MDRYGTDPAGYSPQHGVGLTRSRIGAMLESAVPRALLSIGLYPSVEFEASPTPSLQRGRSLAPNHALLAVEDFAARNRNPFGPARWPIEYDVRDAARKLPGATR